MWAAICKPLLIVGSAIGNLRRNFYAIRSLGLSKPQTTL